jgi:hypothetical protein
MARPLPLALAFFAALAAASPVHATWLPTDGPAALFARADVVARVRVLTVEAVQDPDTERVSTRCAIEVMEAFKGGEAAGAVLALRVPGGTVGDTTVHVEGAPELDPGVEVVVFLRRAGDFFTLVGLGQGVWVVVPAPDGDRLGPASTRSARARFRDPTRPERADTLPRVDTLRGAGAAPR